ncbi:MAG TPA: hypothetical protein VKT49_05615 [Bryobacteraceae bacterium]|nr:hypothetical protein [Bryobacteraceae bacterium]
MNAQLPVGSALRAFHHYREISRSRSTRVSAGECAVCLGQHDEDIHIATIRIHRWFRGEVTKGLTKRPVC